MKTKQVKCFRDYYAADVEYDVNYFLRTNPNINIISTSASVFSDPEDGMDRMHYFWLTYEEEVNK